MIQNIVFSSAMQKSLDNYSLKRLLVKVSFNLSFWQWLWTVFTYTSTHSHTLTYTYTSSDIEHYWVIAWLLSLFNSFQPSLRKLHYSVRKHSLTELIAVIHVCRPHTKLLGPLLLDAENVPICSLTRLNFYRTIKPIITQYDQINRLWFHTYLAYALKVNRTRIRQFRNKGLFSFQAPLQTIVSKISPKSPSVTASVFWPDWWNSYE